MGKVCDNLGSCYTGDIAAGIEYVALNDVAKILSISLGGGGTPSSNCDTDFLANKINWAVLNYGITAVIAAGNTGSIVSSPACASKAIAVGAVARNDTRPSWSGSGNALDIVSPGVDIYSTMPGNEYAYLSGTSMATPQVSATIALLKQKNSDLTDSAIKDALYKTAKDLGSAGWDRYYGWGRVDALAAVNSVPLPGSFDFSIGVNPAGASVTQGGSIKVNVTITLLSGSSQPVSLSGSISPATTKISGGLSPTTGYPTYTSVGSISTFTDTPPGTYTITITGNGGALTRSTTFTLTVIAASKPSLAVSVTTDKASYTYGSTVYLTIKVTDSSTGNGVAGAALKVTLTGPNGVIGSGTGTTDPNGFLYANFKISSSFPAGTYTLQAEASASGYNPGSGSTTFQVS
jgi:hypothetical protein